MPLTLIAFAGFYPPARRASLSRQAQRLYTAATVEVATASTVAVEDDEGCALARRAVQASGLVNGLAMPELRGYEPEHYDQGLRAAAHNTRPGLVVGLARPRSCPGNVVHRSITAQLLECGPVPVLVPPAAA